jgi:protein phosphatase
VVAGLSHPGRVRAENQDACGEFRDAEGSRLCVVADGMGGHRGGATASRTCVETLGRVFETSKVPIRERLAQGLLEANREIRALAEALPDLGRMGTTVVALALAPAGTGWVAWVGDSRAYRLRGGILTPLTRDHSLVAEWVRVGVLRPEEAHGHPRRNELLRSVGPLEELEVDVEPVEVRPGDRYLLCSDGLWGEVSDAEIAAVLAGEAPETAASRLVEMANARGAPDNVTVQVAAVAGADGPSRSVPGADARARRLRWLLAALAAAAALALVARLAATCCGDAA